MNRKIYIVGLMVPAILSLSTLTSCSPSPDAMPTTGSVQPLSNSTATSAVQTNDEASTVLIVDEEGITSIDQEALAAAVTPQDANALTNEEIAGLLYMREEEKLAHDIYMTLLEQWGTNTFRNIANSEATHSEAIRTLLNQYILEDPAEGNGVGIFTDPTLQALYDQLAAQGSQSLADALRVGASVEEIDILDLEKHLAQTTHADISLVYQNLMTGSRNHLRAFVSALSRQTGETYQSQYLSQAVFDAIIATSTERGRGHGNNP
jgi:hypothetical protein